MTPCNIGWHTEQRCPVHGGRLHGCDRGGVHTKHRCTCGATMRAGALVSHNAEVVRGAIPQLGHQTAERIDHRPVFVHPGLRDAPGWLVMCATCNWQHTAPSYNRARAAHTAHRGAFLGSTAPEVGS